LEITVEISPGELLDKLTILQLKLERISDPAKLANVQIEYATLLKLKNAVLGEGEKLDRFFEDLLATNGEIWDLEDSIRDCERTRDFGSRFIDIARLVYRTNDRRAIIKKNINIYMNSRIVEEKSYSDY
jgi:hypothetical protein